MAGEVAWPVLADEGKRRGTGDAAPMNKPLLVAPSAMPALLRPGPPPSCSPCPEQGPPHQHPETSSIPESSHILVARCCSSSRAEPQLSSSPRSSCSRSPLRREQSHGSGRARTTLPAALEHFLPAVLTPGAQGSAASPAVAAGLKDISSPGELSPTTSRFAAGRAVKSRAGTILLPKSWVFLGPAVQQLGFKMFAFTHSCMHLAYGSFPGALLQEARAVADATTPPTPSLLPSEGQPCCRVRCFYCAMLLPC